MASNLEQTITRVLERTRGEIESRLSESLKESHGRLDGTLADLEAEYDRIVSDGRKEADKIEKQIVGSSDLEARNRELTLVEGAVDRVFAEALKRISGAERDGAYADLVGALLREATDALGSTDVVVHTGSSDRETVRAALGDFEGARLADGDMECLGGVRVVSGQGTMAFDNTLDARISRLKPLIRKEIAAKFGVVN